MTVVETWSSITYFNAHTMTPPLLDLRKQLTPISGALYDERLFSSVT